jgi:hypothetical protein
MVPSRLWYRTDCALRCCPMSILMYWPGMLADRSSFISGELQAGGTHILSTSCTLISTVTLDIYLYQPRVKNGSIPNHKV